MFVISTSRTKPRAYATEVHRLSKILGARKVTRSVIHTEDPRNIRCHSRNLVAQVTWHLAFIHPYHLLYRTASNIQLHGDQLMGPVYLNTSSWLSWCHANMKMNFCFDYLCCVFFFIHTPAVIVSMCCQHIDAL